MITLNINGREYQVDVSHDKPLLWVLRDDLRMTGTKFGCGSALCGACTVHIDGHPARACVMPVGAAVGRLVTTVEGIGETPLGKRVQQTWAELNVPQCGYCQSGQVLAAVALLAKNPKPSDADIDQAMSGNICRCGTYPRIRLALHRLAGTPA
jgi:isoquinoline 1-oxidoreductase subunit alpha